MGAFSPQVEARAGMWYNEARGEGTPVRKKASKKLRILLEPRLALILLIAIAAGVVFAALWGPLRPGSRPEPRLLLFWALRCAADFGLLCVGALLSGGGGRARRARPSGAGKRRRACVAGSALRLRAAREGERAAPLRFPHPRP